MAAANTAPTAYRASPLPSLPSGLGTFIARELRRIEQVLSETQDMLPQDAREAPDRPRSGMIRRAVSPWRPVVGQTTDRWVQFDGTTWTYLV